MVVVRAIGTLPSFQQADLGVDRSKFVCRPGCHRLKSDLAELGPCIGLAQQARGALIVAGGEPP